MIESMERIRHLLPLDMQKRFDEEEKKRAELREKMRQECAEVLRRVADAIASPNISRPDLEEAQKRIARALSLAAVLDPEE